MSLKFLRSFIFLSFYLVQLGSFGQENLLKEKSKMDSIQLSQTDTNLTKRQQKRIIRSKTPPEVRDSLLYTKIKSRMGKTKLGKGFYSLLFKDVYNSNTKSQISVLEVNPFQEFEGKLIRSIRIKRLNVFGTSVYDTSRTAKNTFEKFANSLHISTKEPLIRNSFLFFDVGDLVDPKVLKDNERLLRQQPFFHDARIYITPISNKPNSVDILIVTQDTWSLIPIINYTNKQKFGVTFDHNNYKGTANQIKAGFNYNANARVQKTEVFGRYTIPYIKRSLITAFADLKYLEIEKSATIKVFRPFLTASIKYAGAAELSHIRLTRSDKPRGVDSTFYFPVNFNLSDIWAGRAFRLFFGDENLKEKSRIIFAARARKLTYLKRPQLTSDTNQTYQNRRTYLFNFGFSNRNYKRDVLIYGFGRTEDVPIGYLAAMVGGKEDAELGNRNYIGFKLANGQYLKNEKGYLYTLVNAGSYLKNKVAEQGVISIESNYFSPLFNWNTARIRQFVTLNYTTGLKRFNTVEERLNIGNEGIRGIKSDSLKGVRKLVFNFETILFSRANIAGFRIAPYLFADIGMINFGEKSFFKGPVYNGFGLGFRFRNENLAFNTFQFRFGFYPNIPNIDAFRFAFGGEQKLSFRDFDISAPEEVGFR